MGQLTAAENARDELGAAVGRQRDLIARLEADLLSLHSVLPRARADGADADEAKQDLDRGQYSTMKMLATELAVPIGQQQEPNVTTEIASKDILSIISAQRDRLHQRVDELERELSGQKQKNKYLESERDKIREDNVKLYGKIKFLQSYRNKSGQTSVKVENDETEARYANEYERHLDPFRKFSLQERQRKYGQLRAYDKAALGLGQWLMSSGHSRAIFFFYLMFLHLLVFVVLYRFAYTESCQRDFQADCIVKFQQHMNRYHPDAAADLHG